MISGITSAQSQSASESLGKVAEFYIEHSYYGLHMIKVLNEPDPKIPDSFDAIAVFAIPLNDIKKAALITEKVTHSVVILLNTESGKGVMAEYSNNNKTGIVQMAPGILAKQQYSHVRNPYGQYSSLSNGFYKCNMAFYQLEMFNRWFTSISNYHYVAHNCQVYHRSLVATALTGHFMYNFRAKKSAWNQLWSSHDWFDGKTHSIKLRNEIKANMLRKMTLRELVEKYKIPSTTINNVAIEYDSCCHTVIEPKNMDVVFVNECEQMDVQLAEAISNADNEKLLSLLKECYKERMISTAIGDAFNALFAADNHFVVEVEDAELLFLLHSTNNLHVDSFLQYLSRVKAVIVAIEAIDSTTLSIRTAAQKTVVENYQSASKATDFALQPKFMTRLFSRVVNIMNFQLTKCEVLIEDNGVMKDVFDLSGDLFSFLQSLFQPRISILSEALVSYLLDNFIEPKLMDPIVLYCEWLKSLNEGKKPVKSSVVTALLYALLLSRSVSDPVLNRAIILEVFYPLKRTSMKSSLNAGNKLSLTDCGNPIMSTMKLLVEGNFSDMTPTAVCFIHTLFDQLLSEHTTGHGMTAEECVQFMQYIHVLPKNMLASDEMSVACRDVSLNELQSLYRPVLEPSCILDDYMHILHQPRQYFLTAFYCIAHVVFELAFFVHSTRVKGDICRVRILNWLLDRVKSALQSASISLLESIENTGSYSIVIYKEVLQGYGQGQSWKQHLQQLCNNPILKSELPVPSSRNLLRKDIQFFVILRALFKRMYELTQSTSVKYSELCSRIYADDILALNELNAGSIVDGATYDMRGAKFLDAVLVTSNSTGKKLTFRPKLCFVNTSTKLVLTMKSPTGSGFKVFLAVPLLFAEARFGMDEKFEVCVTIRSWTKLPQLPLESLLTEDGQNVDSFASLGFNEPQAPFVWEISLIMDTEKSAQLVVDHIESSRRQINEAKMKKLKQVLGAWGALNGEEARDPEV